MTTPIGTLLLNNSALLYSPVYNDGVIRKISVPSFKLKVTGLKEGQTLGYKYVSESDRNLISTMAIIRDGIYDIPQSYPIEPDESTPNGSWIGFITNTKGDYDATLEVLSEYEGSLYFDGVNDYGTVKNLTYGVKSLLMKINWSKNNSMLMLPLYPNGLVLDGVNDHLINENIPAFTDYTYIIKRTILSIPDNAATLLKGAHKQNGGAFLADYGNKWQFNFGQYNTIQPVQGLSWATKNSYNGTAITTGTNTDDAGITVGKFSNGYAQMVFYKLMLYPKTITNLEIMFLKNMFERDEIINLNNPIFIQK